MILKPEIVVFLSTCIMCNTKKSKNINRRLVIKPLISENFNETGSQNNSTSRFTVVNIWENV